MMKRKIATICALIATLLVTFTSLSVDASKDRTGTEATEQKLEHDVKLEGIPPDKGAPTQIPPSVRRGFMKRGKDRTGTQKTEQQMEEEVKSEGIPLETGNDVKPIVKRGKSKKKNKQEKKGTTFPVKSLGVNCHTLMKYSALFTDMPVKNKLREGFATDTDSCDKVTKVPASLRNKETFYYPVDKAYQKYTEAYGIPILGSSNVTDEGLKRACYEVKFLLAHRYDVRNAYYCFYGRVALIGDGEQQTSLPEYRTWDSKYWDARVRGLGPSLNIPLTSAGDDNQRCKTGDRYARQDILVHEFCHGIHLMGAIFTIAGFQRRLISAYNSAMNNGKYAGKYASKNKNEYFAVGCQIYFDALDTNEIIYTDEAGYEVIVNNRDTLKTYDPALVALLEEVFPCPNEFVHRCKWKTCDFKLKYSRDQYTAKSLCPVIKAAYNKATSDDCAKYACQHMGNAFNFKATPKAKYCYVLRCTKGLQIAQDKGAFDVYEIERIPEMDLTAEKSTPMQTMCTSNVDEAKISDSKTKSVRCDIPEADRTPYGPDPTGDSADKCNARGGCHGSTGCYYPTQDAADTSVSCFEFATEETDMCVTDPGRMLKDCPLSCNAAEYSYRLNMVDKYKTAMQNLCSNEYDDCSQADCGTPSEKKCRLTCGLCNLPSDWRKVIGIPNLDITPVIALAK